eukprot:1145859-Pyramimonas_sp.AAC.1
MGFHFGHRDFMDVRASKLRHASENIPGRNLFHPWHPEKVGNVQTVRKKFTLACAPLNGDRHSKKLGCLRSLGAWPPDWSSDSN